MEQSIVPSVAIMSVYNAKPIFLQKQIESILNQSVAIDLFIRDDGSTDSETLATLKTYENNPRIHVSYGQNIGFVRSFFKTLRLADNHYMFFFISDQDDYWEPNRVQNALSAIRTLDDQITIQQFPLLCYSGIVICDSFLNPIEHFHPPFTPSFRNAVSEIPIPGMSMMINSKLREMALKAERFDMPGHDWWFYLIATAFGRVVEDPSISLQYRRHDSNVSNYSRSFLGQIKWKLQAYLFGDGLKDLRNMILEFDACFGSDDRLSPENRELLSLFTAKDTLANRLKLALYPRRFRATITGEIGYRALIFIKKI